MYVMAGKQPVLIRAIAEMREALKPLRARGCRIGLVPTMGALHAGHASLMSQARAACDTVVASVYVNPTQFGPNEDFSKYPRQLEHDLKVCGQQGVDFVFAPTDQEMYAGGTLTMIHVAKRTERLCGATRPGHFDGVCTVVAKLFHIVQPDAAYFGQKDAQQAVVLQRMVADLSFPVQIVVCPIVREPDGLALSSRNAYLEPTQRKQALCLYHALQAGQQAIARGIKTSDRINAIMRDVIQAAGPFAIDYLEVVDTQTLEAVELVTGTVLLAGAIRVGTVRLIDNLLVEAS
jgi:pantoate--beta-alanine ligase